MKHLFLGLSLLLASNWAMAQNIKIDTTKATVGINSEYSYKMLEPNQDLRKIQILLEERKKGNLQNRSLTIGASVIAIADYQYTNKDSKFAYLMRHPTAANEIGNILTEVALHSFQLGLTGAINNWLTAYAEILYDPEQSFGAGTITALTRNQLQLRKGYVLVGDLNKCPVYGALGKMDAPFGEMGSVNPFSNSTMWHGFAGLGYGAEVGFKKWGLNARFMAIQGGAQFRGLNTSVGDSTAVPSLTNNFAADLNYTIGKQDLKLMVGASYVHGTSYCQDFPVNHFGVCGSRNPAYTYYAHWNYKNRITFIGAFAKTLQAWPGTHNPQPPLDIYAASKVSSLELGAKYNFHMDGQIQYAISGEFSNFDCGPDGSPWDRQNQIVLGFCGMIHHSSKLFFEAFRTDGYVPLNFISGSEPNNPFPEGQTHSVRDAFSYGILIGAQLTI